MNTRLMQNLSGLSDISQKYHHILCDVWGVVHNGVAAFESACESLCKFREQQNGSVALITNAPRPSGPIIEQLKVLGVPDHAYDAVVTSGDVTRDLMVNHTSKKVYRLGPDRDIGLFQNLDVELVDSDEAELVACTGLVDDTTETPDDYREILQKFANRNLKMVCANPDVKVIRGEQMIWCAGALAKLFQEFGGQVEYAGKPHKPIYDLALRKLSEIHGEPIAMESVIAIGDGLPTDIKGANENGIDALFITAGIHGADFGPIDSPDESKVRAKLENEGFKAVAFLPHLTW